MKYAVFMDYELDGVRNTVVLGGSIFPKWYDARIFLDSMAYAYRDEDGDVWCVPEADLPWGYTYQTYYVSAYDGKQLMIGVK